MGGLGENASRRFAPVVGERAGADSVKTENALGRDQMVAVMGRGVVDCRSLGDDPGRIDACMAPVVVDLDVIHPNGVGNAGNLI